MKEYHVVFEGMNGFQKELIVCFKEDKPSSTYYMREYQQFSPTPSSLHSFPIPDVLQIKQRCFRLKSSFYALGKNIAYYTEEPC